MSASFQPPTPLHSPSLTKFLAYARVISRVRPTVFGFASEGVIKAVNGLTSSNLKQTHTTKYSKYKAQTNKQTNKQTNAQQINSCADLCSLRLTCRQDGSSYFERSQPPQRERMCSLLPRIPQHSVHPI